MRMRNTGDQTRQVTWKDLTGSDFGQFAVPPHSDFFFHVQGGGAASVISATSGTTTVQANGTGAPCQGQITVNLVTVGDAPAGQTWNVRVSNGDNGNVNELLRLDSGDSKTLSVPGGYVAGAAAIDEVVGGAADTALRSIVVASSDTPETNTANNTAQANVTTFSTATVHAQISAPPVGRVATQLSYRVTAALGRNSRAAPVRLCTQPPKSLVQVRAPGTFKYHGVYCRDYALLLPGRSVSFLVYAFPSATGRVTASARATAVGSPREARASAQILLAGAVACPAAVRKVARGRRPTARAAC